MANANASPPNALLCVRASTFPHIAAQDIKIDKTHIRTNIHTCTYTYIHMYIRTYIHIYIQTYIQRYRQTDRYTPIAILSKGSILVVQKAAPFIVQICRFMSSCNSLFALIGSVDTITALVSQHTAAHCSTLQHTIAHCSTLQHTAVKCQRGEFKVRHQECAHVTQYQHTHTQSNLCGSPTY